MVNVVEISGSARAVVQREGRWELQGEAVEEWQSECPGSLRQMIEQQLARVRPGRARVLEAASVAGAEFSAAAVAAGVETEVRGGRRAV